MPTQTEQVLHWLKDFKCTWLLQNILNNPQLINLISKKFEELERLLTRKNFPYWKDIFLIFPL